MTTFGNKQKILFAKRPIRVHIALMESASVPRVLAQPRDRESLAKGLAVSVLLGKARLLHGWPTVPFFVGLFSVSLFAVALFTRHRFNSIGTRCALAHIEEGSRYASHITHTTRIVSGHR